MQARRWEEVKRRLKEKWEQVNYKAPIADIEADYLLYISSVPRCGGRMIWEGLSAGGKRWNASEGVHDWGAGEI